MTKKLTITVPDDVYASLQSVARAEHRTPEELAAQVVLERLSALVQQAEPPQARDQLARQAVLAVMRHRHHLAEYAPKTSRPGSMLLPSVGSSERTRLDEETAADLGDALAQSGLSVLDLIERR